MGVGDRVRRFVGEVVVLLATAVFVFWACDEPTTGPMTGTSSGKTTSGGGSSTSKTTSGGGSSTSKTTGGGDSGTNGDGTEDPDDDPPGDDGETMDEDPGGMGDATGTANTRGCACRSDSSGFPASTALLLVALGVRRRR